MKSSWLKSLLLAVILVTLNATCAYAYSNLWKCVSNLKELVLAVKAYQEATGALPTDITDDLGRPLLSWRVRILPYVDEPGLYRRINLKEPWDSKPNFDLINNSNTSRLFSCPSSNLCVGRSHYVKVLGAKNIMLAEVDADHAPYVSEPVDLNYDPSIPLAGLAKRHHNYNTPMRGGFVALADGQFRFIPEGTPDELVRELFTGDDIGSLLSGRPWYQALTLPSARPLALTWLAMLGCGVGGALWVCGRLLKGLPVTPGEWLWFMLGAGQLVQLVVIMACYKSEVFPSPGRNFRWEFWIWPTLVMMLSGIVPVFHKCSVPSWRGFFVFICLAYLCLLGLTKDGPPFESFLTAESPWALASFSLIAMYKTTTSEENVARVRAHWLGMAICLAPLVALLVMSACGLASPIPQINLGVQILE